MSALAAGMTLEQFWNSTPYEWRLYRDAWLKRLQAQEVIAAWHVERGLAPYRKSSIYRPPPFSKL